MEVNSDPRAPAGRIRRSGQGQGTYVSRPSNPAPTSHSPTDDGMATQCRAQSRRCLRRALLLLVPAVLGVSLSQRQDVRTRPRGGRSRTDLGPYPISNRSREPDPTTMHHAHACAVARARASVANTKRHVARGQAQAGRQG